MKCENVRELIDKYVAGELPESVSDAIRRHLSTCHDCQQEVLWAREALESSDPNRERRRHATSIWMEKKRRKMLLSEESPRQRMIKYVLIGLFFALAIMGVRWRSENFREMFPKAHQPDQAESLVEVIQTSLDLTDEEFSGFMKLYEQVLTELRPDSRELELITLKIDNFDPDQPGEEPMSRLLDRRLELQNKISSRRDQFYRDVAAAYGSQRSQALLQLKEQIW